MMRELSDEGYARRVIRPSWRSLVPSAIAAVGVSGGIYYWMVVANLPALRVPIEFSDHAVTIVLPLFLLILLVVMARPLIALVDSVHIIGAHHLYTVVGRCSLSRKQIEVPYEDMRGVRSEQTILDRILNIGTVVVWTATAESVAEKMTHIYNPKEIVAVILDRIDNARMKSQNVQPGQDLEDQSARPRSGPEIRAA